MQRAGVKLHNNVSELSVVGLVEVLKHYPRLRKILNKTKNTLKKEKPDLLILIDSPDFNLPLAKTAKQCGIKVLYYISPQIWAWRTGRVKKIKKNIDLMAVLFPFELEFYREANVDACLVRHPLLDDIDNAYSNSCNNNKQLTIGLLPGSRKNEIKKLMPVMIEAAKILFNKNNGIEFIIPVAPGTEVSDLKRYNIYNLPIIYKQDKFYYSISQCAVLAVASGTATLQTALMGKPMVVTYKISPITYKVFGHMINVKHICIANIILNRRAYPELIQNNAIGVNIADEISKIISDQEIGKNTLADREELYDKLNSGMDSNALAEKAMALTR